MTKQHMTLANRPEIVESESWYYDDNRFEKSIGYLSINGGSPDITNHLSLSTYDIVDGVGSFMAGGMTAHVKSGDRVTIEACNRFSYIGDNLIMLITHNQALHPDYVTFGNDKLGKQEAKTLRRLERQDKFNEFAGRLMGSIEPLIDAQLYVSKYRDQVTESMQ